MNSERPLLVEHKEFLLNGFKIIVILIEGYLWISAEDNKKPEDKFSNYISEEQVREATNYIFSTLKNLYANLCHTLSHSERGIIITISYNGVLKYIDETDPENPKSFIIELKNDIKTITIPANHYFELTRALGIIQSNRVSNSFSSTKISTTRDISNQQNSQESFGSTSPIIISSDSEDEDKDILTIQSQKRSTKKTKEEGYPARSKSAFEFYEMINREHFKNVFSNVSRKERLFNIKQLWKALPESEKEKYKEYHQRDLERYKKEKAEFDIKRARNANLNLFELEEPKSRKQVPVEDLNNYFK